MILTPITPENCTGLGMVIAGDIPFHETKIDGTRKLSLRYGTYVQCEGIVDGMVNCYRKRDGANFYLDITDLMIFAEGV